MSAHEQLPSGWQGILTAIALLASSSAAIWPFRRRDRAVDAEGEAPDQVQEEEAANQPDFFDWALRLALLGKPDKAMARFKRAIDITPEDAAAHYNLGLCLHHEGKYSDALESYSRAAELAPDSSDIRANIGLAMLETGDIAGAIEHLKKAVELAPDDAEASFDLGCALAANNELDDAAERFREAAKADPKDPQIRFNLAVTLVKADKPDQAENDFRDFLALAGDRFSEQRAFAEKFLAERSSGEAT